MRAAEAEKNTADLIEKNVKKIKAGSERSQAPMGPFQMWLKV